MWLPSWRGNDPRFRFSAAMESRYTGPATGETGSRSVAARIASSASRWRASLLAPTLVRPRNRKMMNPANGMIRIRISHAIAEDGFLLLGSTPIARNLMT